MKTTTHCIFQVGDYSYLIEIAECPGDKTLCIQTLKLGDHVLSVGSYPLEDWDKVLYEGKKWAYNNAGWKMGFFNK